MAAPFAASLGAVVGLANYKFDFWQSMKNRMPSFVKVDACKCSKRVPIMTELVAGGVDDDYELVQRRG
jgi:hypothetical protein